MKRNIITIDENRCDGCGLCIPDCPEGALQVIDGKARLVSDLFCDGLGACVGSCPNDAIIVEEREAKPYDEKKVMANIIKHGKSVIQAHLDHLTNHGKNELYDQAVEYLRENNIEMPAISGNNKKIDQIEQCGCPGAKAQEINRKGKGDRSNSIEIQSELQQWPVQLKLLNPNAPYLKNADLLISSDCVPFAYGNFHRKFLRDKVVIMFCPKLDPYIDEYIEKMAAIFSNNKINSITIARMEVPCCGGTRFIVEEALKKAGKDITINEYIISIGGDII